MARLAQNANVKFSEKLLTPGNSRDKSIGDNDEGSEDVRDDHASQVVARFAEIGEPARRASRQDAIRPASKDPALPAIGTPAVERVQQELRESSVFGSRAHYMRNRRRSGYGQLQKVLRVLISIA